MSWLEQHCPQIDKLAYVLLEHDQLDGKAVKHIIEKSGALLH